MPLNITAKVALLLLRVVFSAQVAALPLLLSRGTLPLELPSFFGDLRLLVKCKTDVREQAFLYLIAVY